MFIVEFYNSGEKLRFSYTTEDTINTIIDKLVTEAKKPYSRFEEVVDLDFDEFRNQFSDDAEVLTDSSEVSWLLDELDTFLSDSGIYIESYEVK